MPPSAHHFIPVWQSLDGEKTYRSKVYGPSKKRKRQPAQEDSDDEDSWSRQSTPLPSGTQDRRKHSVAKNDPYRVAGWSRDLPLPEYPFPHAPVKEPRRDHRLETIQEDLAALNPPLYIPPAPQIENARTSLRRHHLSVMTTIMHTSLLRRDFVRAGRAWGMILRTELLGRSIDVRTHERWGIGAEILLRQHTDFVSNTSNNNQDDQEDEESSPNQIIIGQEGFQLAKDYYERLILQYPYQKTHPNATSSLDFYPAMYGLCIYEIQQKHKQALKQAERASRSPSPVYDQNEGDSKDEIGPAERRTTAVKQSTLKEAIALADRMSELMLNPPMKDDLPFMQLRAMLALWIIDLCNGVISADPGLESVYDLRIEKEKEEAKRFHSKGGEPPEFFSLED